MNQRPCWIRAAGEVLETVTRLNKEEGITVIMITHFMEEAVAADRIFILDGGQIAMTGYTAGSFPACC
jgi:ABC-type multidrug transport system ATPase subunit